MKGLEGNPAEIPPPPWQLSGPFVCVGAAFDRAAIRKLLPPQFEPTEDATGGFYHYIAREGWGIGPYAIGFGYVDVEGYDAPDGSKGKVTVAHFATKRGNDGFQRYFNFSHGAEGHAEISVADGIAEARSGAGNTPQLRCRVRIKGDEASTPLASGVNYWVYEHRGEVNGMACAFTSRFLEAEPLAVEITTPDDHPLSMLRPRQLLWAGYIPDSSFNISSPYVLGSSLRLAQPGREAAYLALLAELGLGAVVVRQDLRPLYINAVAQALMGDGLALVGGILWPAEAALRRALAAAIEGVLAEGAARTPPAPMALPRPSGRKPLIVQVFRLNTVHVGMAEEAAALLLITDPARGQKADPLRSLQLLGLTLAEARIAALVGSGLSPREAAELAGNSENTVRSTLRQVYDKLDIGRQSELARLVTRLEVVGL